jgi:hypothetical protein
VIGMGRFLRGSISEFIIDRAEKPLIAIVKKLNSVNENLQKEGYEIRGLSITLKGRGPLPEITVDLGKTGNLLEQNVKKKSG